MEEIETGVLGQHLTDADYHLPDRVSRSPYLSPPSLTSQKTYSYRSIKNPLVSIFQVTELRANQDESVRRELEKLADQQDHVTRRAFAEASLEGKLLPDHVFDLVTYYPIPLRTRSRDRSSF